MTFRLQDDLLCIANKSFSSRLMLGTGKYKTTSVKLDENCIRPLVKLSRELWDLLWDYDGLLPPSGSLGRECGGCWLCGGQHTMVCSTFNNNRIFNSLTIFLLSFGFNFLVCASLNIIAIIYLASYVHSSPTHATNSNPRIDLANQFTNLTMLKSKSTLEYLANQGNYIIRWKSIP